MANKVGKWPASLVLGTLIALTCLSFVVYFIWTLIAGGAFEGLSPADDSFHKAAAKGNLAEVKKFLDEGKDPDAKGLDPNDQGGGALMAALVTKHYDVAALLVRYGADVNKIHNGRPLIFDFVRGNDMRTYEWLIHHGAKVDEGTKKLLQLPPEQRYRYN